MGYKTIILEREAGVAILTFNRPEKLNAWSIDLVDEMSDAIDEVSKDNNTKALIITGAGRGFCSGGDVQDELKNNPDGSIGAGFERVLQGGKATPLNVIPQLHGMQKPVIAAINGVAAGAGFSCALACDLRIASEKAKFSAVFILRGLVPDAGMTYFLPKLVGAGKAYELVFTGEMIDAREAERIGLVNKVVPHGELMKTAEELAVKLAKRPPLALRYAKRAISKGLTEVDLASHLDYEAVLNGLCWATEDFKEGVKAYLEKREPIFKGK